MAWLPAPDGSRDRRVEDPTNLYIVHLAGRALLPLALRLGVTANPVSLFGLTLGAAGAASLYRWYDWRFATLGFFFGVCWLIADGLDGMIARATRTSSAFGRFLDGACDHVVFVLIYVSLASSLGTSGSWWLAIAAGAAHAVQATLYEGERTRFHRRLRGEHLAPPGPASRNQLVRLYDAVANSFDRKTQPFERWLAGAPNRAAAVTAYGACAVPPLKLMALLSNNMRLVVIYLACLVGDPRWFWIIELTILTWVLVIGIAWLRKAESELASARSL